MIASVEGRIIAQGPDHVVVQVGGVGLRVFVPRTVFDTIDGVGHRVSLITHLSVKEDSLTLYGFIDEEEKQVFETLLTISGIGPKIALGILSTLSLGQLQQAVTREEADLLTRVPGVGKKSAQKIVFELKDKLRISGPPELAGLVDIDSDVLDALIGLGYSVVEAQAAIQSIPRDAGSDLETRVRLALGYFS